MLQWNFSIQSTKIDEHKIKAKSIVKEKKLYVITLNISFEGVGYYPLENNLGVPYFDFNLFVALNTL